MKRPGSCRKNRPSSTGEGIKLFADPRNEAALKPQATSLRRRSRRISGRIGAGDYAALLAYIERSPAHIETMQRLRRMIRDRTKAATCVGFGPRFQHSTGQAYKGGPNSGVFLQITCDDAQDLPVPGHSYTFGVVKAAQARGDLEVLAERGRRALRAHITGDLENGLATLSRAVEQACSRSRWMDVPVAERTRKPGSAAAGAKGAAMHLGDFRGRRRFDQAPVDAGHLQSVEGEAAVGQIRDHRGRPRAETGQAYRDYLADGVRSFVSDTASGPATEPFDCGGMGIRRQPHHPFRRRFDHRPTPMRGFTRS